MASATSCTLPRNGKKKPSISLRNDHKKGTNVFPFPTKRERRKKKTVTFRDRTTSTRAKTVKGKKRKKRTLDHPSASGEKKEKRTGTRTSRYKFAIEEKKKRDPQARSPLYLNPWWDYGGERDLHHLPQREEGGGEEKTAPRYLRSIRSYLRKESMPLLTSHVTKREGEGEKNSL